MSRQIDYQTLNRFVVDFLKDDDRSLSVWRREEIVAMLATEVAQALVPCTDLSWLLICFPDDSAITVSDFIVPNAKVVKFPGALMLIKGGKDERVP